MQETTRSNSSHPTNLNLTEAHEVQSVRKRVEGMGVENQTELPSPPTGTNVDQVTSAKLELTNSTNSSQPMDSNSNHSDPKNTEKNAGDHLHDSKINPVPLSPPNSTSNQGPASWDAYADLRAPFACFAPRSNFTIFAQPAITPSPEEEASPDPPMARAFAPLHTFGNQTGSTSPCPNKFPSGSDFFLKGKRNTPLGDSSPDADPESATQNKKLKLPPSSSSASAPMSSASASASSSSNNHIQHGFADYAKGPLTSLKSKALEKLNKNPSLQTSSHEAESAVSSFLKANQPSSRASSACAVNGEVDESGTSTLPTSSALSSTTQASTQVSNSLGFSAFTNKSGFHDASQSIIDWCNRPSNSSVFDQNPQQASTLPDQIKSNTENAEWGPAQSTQKKTHLALSAELSQEDKHEGFLATELVTGEENEDLIKSVRCKMFTLGEDGSWREKGTGGLRLLRTKEEPYRFRLIMRADAVLRVLLNVPIFKGFSYRPTQEKFLTFASTVVVSNNNEDDKPVNGSQAAEVDSTTGSQGENNPKTHFQQYLCRFGKTEARQDMINGIEECLKQLERSQRSETDEASPDASDLV